MKPSIAPAQTDPHERIVKAAVTAVYDRYCSGSISELESAVIALIGQPIPDEGEDDVDMDSASGDLRAGDHLVHPGLPEEQGRAAERLAVLTPAAQTNLVGGEPDLTMLLMSKADAVRKEYQLAHGRPCDCSTPDGALHYGRAQGLEIASDIVGGSASPDTLAEVTKERDHFYNQWRACWAPLTPRSENEKQGVERVLAILKVKLSDGGGIVGPSDVQRAHNDFYRGRRVAFEECATMLRAALTSEGQP